MSTITREWLQQTIAEYEANRDGLPFGLDTNSAIELQAFKLALASLEAEPVAYMHRSGQVVTREECCDDKTFAICCKVETPLYTAPPVTVSVPDERPSLNNGIVGFDEGWNACRAAMLQGAEHVSNRDELPDGWVACSERMPEDEQEVITHNIFGYRHVSFFDEHSGHFFDRLDGSPVDCVEHVLVSHWMPLPAAPQQEA